MMMVTRPIQLMCFTCDGLEAGAPVRWRTMNGAP